jgi:hypothetical protein
MSQEELVEAYVAGTISRRAFVRRLVGTGVSVAAALTYAAALASESRAQSGRGEKAQFCREHFLGGRPIREGKKAMPADVRLFQACIGNFYPPGP